MSRRSHHRPAAVPRPQRGLVRRFRRAAASAPRGITRKLALKRAALRDCLRRCVYCAQSLELDAATIDHVQPLSRGGADDVGNLVVACSPCNRLKGDLLPLQFFARHPWAGLNFMRYARTVHRALKRDARRAVSLSYAA
jgi:5-methylcytosine-specific restriction endonuclease McrA